MSKAPSTLPSISIVSWSFQSASRALPYQKESSSSLSDPSLSGESSPVVYASSSIIAIRSAYSAEDRRTRISSRFASSGTCWKGYWWSCSSLLCLAWSAKEFFSHRLCVCLPYLGTCCFLLLDYFSEGRLLDHRLAQITLCCTFRRAPLSSMLGYSSLYSASWWWSFGSEVFCYSVLGSCFPGCWYFLCHFGLFSWILCYLLGRTDIKLRDISYLFSRQSSARLEYLLLAPGMCLVLFECWLLSWLLGNHCARIFFVGLCLCWFLHFMGISRFRMSECVMTLRILYARVFSFRPWPITQPIPALIAPTLARKDHLLVLHLLREAEGVFILPTLFLNEPWNPSLHAFSGL